MASPANTADAAAARPAPAVVVTGISRGIGLAIAERFEREGFAVAGCASGPAGIEALRARKPHWDLEAVDLADAAHTQAWAQRLLQRLPNLQVLVNNAGRFEPGTLLDEPAGQFEQLLALNLHSAYHLSRALAPRMVAQQHGLIVNICSVASQQAYPSGATYSVTKFALLGLGKGLREELKPHNVRVTNLLPGATHTASWDGANLPPHRLMPPEAVAELAWLAWALPGHSVLEDAVLRPQLGDI